jgi:hypothetical protein
MASPKLTPEVKRDVHMVQMRAFLDPKRFYKKDASNNTFPKYFQIGEIQHGAAAYYSDRIHRKDRKEHIVDELLHDDDQRRYFKRKFSEIQRKRNSGNIYRQLKNRRKNHWKKG